MKTAFLFLGLALTPTAYFAQVNPALNQLVVNVTAQVKESPPSITLNWQNTTATGNDFQIRRKEAEAVTWDLLATVSVSDTSYTDNYVEIGKEYEYRVLKRNNSFTVSWGYLSSGIQVLPRFINRGIILLLDTVVTDSLVTEIKQLIGDLEKEGYLVETIKTDRTEPVSKVKNRIQSLYNSKSGIFKSLLSIGHVPVPYSGDLNPDAHTNHKGAWPSDVFYGDMDGNWTDNSVNNTSGSSVRTHNIPGDGKYDQSTIPSDMELETGRIDFYDLPAFAETEVELLRRYLRKNHAFRNKEFVPGRKGLMDEGSFANNSSGEGFGQSGPRAIVPLFGKNGLTIGDYFTNLKTDSYLWSYGQGAGSYTSCSGIGTTADFAKDSLQTVFTMLFGSYFGDYDSPNNLMRAALASGTILTCSWSSSRPVWYYHHMAMGRNIGYSAVRSLNFDDRYNAINFGASFPTNKGVHVVLLGDPTLRPYYLLPPTNLSALDNGNGDVELNWDVSPDVEVTAYNVYRSPADTLNYQLVNANPIANNSFTDVNISNDGTYAYMVRGVKLEETASGTYYNESPGAFDTTSVVNAVGLSTTEEERGIVIYPNPAVNEINVQSSREILSLSIFSRTGQLVMKSYGTKALNISDIRPGLYVLEIELSEESVFKKWMKQ